MGLRETKAARTRAQIIETALGLFTDHGYDATTMEEIAEHAEVGTTTLYRYFPSKDLILLDPFTHAGALPDALRARPADEPLDIALGAAIVSALNDLTSRRPDINRVRTLIDRSLGPRARLWDLIAQGRHDLEEAVAGRLGEPVDSRVVQLTARTALLIVELAADTWRADEAGESLGGIAARILDELGGKPLIVPRAPLAARANGRR